MKRKKIFTRIVCAILLVSLLSSSYLNTMTIQAEDDTTAEESDIQSADVTWEEPVTDWYKDYSYELDEVNSKIILHSVLDTLSGTYIVIPGKASINGHKYTVVLDADTEYVDTSMSLWRNKKDQIKGIKLNKGVEFIENKCIGLFAGMENVEVIDVTEIDVSNVTDMSRMFYSCKKLKCLDLHTFDTSKVTSMREMFEYCRGLEEVDTSSFNTANVTNMYYMFFYCDSLKNIDVSGFDTSKVTDMTSMFFMCKSLSSLDISNFVFNEECKTQYFINGSKIIDLYLPVSWKRAYLGETTGYEDISNWGKELQHIYYAGTKAQWDAYGYTIPDGVEIVYEYKPASEEDEPAENWYESYSYDLDEINSKIHLKSVLDSFDINNVVVPGKAVINGKEYGVVLDSDQTTQNLSLGNVSLWYKQRDKIKSIKLEKGISFLDNSCRALFYGLTAVQEIDIADIDTSKVTDMSYMFYDCRSLKEISFSGLDTSKVTDMSYMFYNCIEFTELDLRDLNTSSVKNMSHMFEGLTSNWNDPEVDEDCHPMKLEKLDLSSFDTSKVTDMSSMFECCIGLKTLDLSNFNTTNVTNMSCMFAGCITLADIDLSGFDTSKVITMEAMFCSCNSLTKIDLSTFDTKNVKTFDSMFNHCDKATEIVVNKFNTTACIDMQSMFAFCKSLKKIDVSSFDTSNVTYMNNMFVSDIALTDLDISGFVINKTCYIYNMLNWIGAKSVYLPLSWKRFEGDEEEGEKADDISAWGTKLEKIYYPGTKAQWDKLGYTIPDGVEIVYEYKHASEEDEPAISIKLSADKLTIPVDGTRVVKATIEPEDESATVSWNCSDESVLMINTVGNQVTLKGIKEGEAVVTASLTGAEDQSCKVTVTKKQESQAPSDWYKEYTYSIDEERNAIVLTKYNGASAQVTVPSTATIDGITYDVIINSINDPDDGGLFGGHEEIKSISFENGVKADDCSKMFYYCKNLTSIDLKGIDTGNTKRMIDMFGYCSSLKYLDVSSLDTSSVTNMMDMFYHCEALETLDVRNLDTTNVDSMSQMFYYCKALKSLDVSDFKTDKVTNMSFMFAGCETLKSLDISMLNTCNVTNMGYLFSGCKGLTDLNIKGINTDKVTSINYMFDHCSSLTTLDISSLNTSNVKGLQGMFRGCSSLKTIDVSTLDTSNATSMSIMFAECSNLTSLDVSSFDTHNVEDMSSMFYGLTSLKSLDLSKWDVSKVYNMNGMFGESTGLVDLNLSFKDTSKLMTTSMMFTGCTGLEKLDLSSFNTPALTYTMQMFYKCSSLKTVNMSNFDTSKVTDMHTMFSGCSSLESIDLSNFDLGKVEDNRLCSFFGKCDSLQTIETPYNVKCKELEELPAEFTGSDGKTYLNLPRNSQSITLTRKTGSGNKPSPTPTPKPGDNGDKDDTNTGEITINGEKVDSLKSAFKKMKDSGKDYILVLGSDVKGEKNLTIPKTAKSVTINGNGHVIEITGTKFTSKTNLTLTDVTICTKTKKGAAAKFTLDTKKDLSIEGKVSFEASAVTLKCSALMTLKCGIYAKTVIVKDLALEEGAALKPTADGSITVKGILKGNGGEIVLPDNFKKPVVLKGAVSGTVKLSGVKQADGTQILKASTKKINSDALKTAFNVTGITDNIIDTYLYYTAGGKVCIFGESIGYGGKKYGVWKDAVAAMNADVKAAKNTGSKIELAVTIIGDVNLNGTFKLPTKGYGKLILSGTGTMTFTGDIKLTGDTWVEGITFRKTDKKGNEQKLKIVKGKYQYNYILTGPLTKERVPSLAANLASAIGGRVEKSEGDVCYYDVIFDEHTNADGSREWREYSFWPDEDYMWLYLGDGEVSHGMQAGNTTYESMIWYEYYKYNELLDDLIQMADNEFYWSGEALGLDMNTER